ncbi:MAG: hypothetical protein WD002_08870 [Pseudomonadales bacterium]
MVNEDVGKTNLWMKQRWETGTDTFELIFMGYDNQWNSADQIPARAVKQGLVSKFGSIDPTLGGESSRYSLSANWNNQLNSGSLQAALYGIDYDMELYSNFSYFVAPQDDQFQQVDQRKIYGGMLAWSQESLLGDIAMINTLGAQLRSVAGVRYDYYDFKVTALAAADSSTLRANSGTESDDLISWYPYLSRREAECFRFLVATGDRFGTDFRWRCRQHGRYWRGKHSQGFGANHLLSA